MATFPNTPVLDNFTRADENPLTQSGDWYGPIYTGDAVAKLVSDQVVPASGSSGDMYWGLELGVGPVEVYATLASWAHQPFIACCLSDVGGSTVNYGYWLYADSSTTLKLENASGILATYTVTLGAGDSIGMSVRGGVVTVWHKPSSGIWTALGTTDDDTATFGYFGFGWFAAGSGTPGPFTSFGGGRVPAPAPVSAPAGARGLSLVLTDLTGAPIGPTARPLPLRTSAQPQVTIPLCDSRTGQVQISAYEEIAGPLAEGAATTCLKVVYTNPKGVSLLVLNGVVLQPTADFDAATVTATVCDPTLRLKKRYCHWLHVCMNVSDGKQVSSESYDAGVDAYAGVNYYHDGLETDYGIPMDGRGLRLLVWDAGFGTEDRPGSNATASSTPGTGITQGVDDTTPQPNFGAGGIPPNGVPSFTATATLGSDELTACSFSGSYTIADILKHARLDGPGLPAYCAVLWASGTTIKMSKEATASITGGTFSSEDAIYCQLTRGDCMYDDIRDIVLGSGSFQFNLVPIDAAHPGPSGVPWEAGQMAELYTADQVGTDRSRTQALAGGGVTPVLFAHGQGGFHLVYAPDADQLRTYVTEVGPGGPADPLDQYNKALVYGDTTETYGLYEDWEMASTAGSGDSPISNALLTNRANAILAAYQNVPQFITATIDSDEIGAYCYGSDFFEGDIVTVFGRKGAVTVGPLDVRITQVGITQTDANGNCQITLTMVPYLTVTSGADDSE